jgi:hypothetical protein
VAGYWRSGLLADIAKGYELFRSKAEGGLKIAVTP